MDLHVLPNLEFTIIDFVNFNLWMSRGGIDTFALVINYLDEGQTPWHVIVELIEMDEMVGNAMAL